MSTRDVSPSSTNHDSLDPERTDTAPGKEWGLGQYALTLLFFQNDPTTGALHSYGKVRETVRITNGLYEGVLRNGLVPGQRTPVFHSAATTEGRRIPVQGAP
jgi:hypothetical protein